MSAEATSSGVTSAIATTLRQVRLARGLSVSALAAAAGVSRAMIGKIEREEVQPTAVLLGRLSGALGLTLSELFARAEDGQASRLLRVHDQPIWTDPATGYRRRAVSPTTSAVQLIEVELPPGATVPYPADAYTFSHHMLWVLDGTLHFREANTNRALHPGDCLELGEPSPCVYSNRTASPCRYLVVLAKHTR
jgi:transcriptional regulator with XRE-family HTH domain